MKPTIQLPLLTFWCISLIRLFIFIHVYNRPPHDTHPHVHPFVLVQLRSYRTRFYFLLFSFHIQLRTFLHFWTFFMNQQAWCPCDSPLYGCTRRYLNNPLLVLKPLLIFHSYKSLSVFLIIFLGYIPRSYWVDRK